MANGKSSKRAACQGTQCARCPLATNVKFAPLCANRQHSATNARTRALRVMCTCSHSECARTVNGKGERRGRYRSLRLVRTREVITRSNWKIPVAGLAIFSAGGTARADPSIGLDVSIAVPGVSAYLGTPPAAPYTAAPPAVVYQEASAPAYYPAPGAVYYAPEMPVLDAV